MLFCRRMVGSVNHFYRILPWKGRGFGALALMPLAWRWGVYTRQFHVSDTLYFLLTVRFGIEETNKFVLYEKWIHALILLFCISTAMAGIFLGIFRPNILAPGCWISAPAKGCSEDCPEAKWAWLFGELSSILTLIGFSISNVMLYLHVRKEPSWKEKSEPWTMNGNWQIIQNIII